MPSLFIIRINLTDTEFQGWLITDFGYESYSIANIQQNKPTSPQFYEVVYVLIEFETTGLTMSGHRFLASKYKNYQLRKLVTRIVTAVIF